MEDAASQLSLGQGRQAEREEAQPEREGSCRHAKAAFGFNARRQEPGWGPRGAGVFHRLPTGPKPCVWGHTWRVPKEPSLTAGDAPQAHHQEERTLHHPTASPSPSPALHLTPSRLSSPHPGSQAVPRRPLLRAGEVLSQALYSYLYRAVINSQWLAAATRGGCFCPPATLQRQGLICLKHTPQPFHGDPFQFHGARAALAGNTKERLIYRSAFQSLPASLSTLAGGSGESPSPSNVHRGQRLSRGGQDGAVRRGCWIEVPVPPLPGSWSPPAPYSCW